MTGTPLPENGSPGSPEPVAPPAAVDGPKGSSPSSGYRGAPWPSSGAWPAPPSGSRPEPAAVPGVPESPAAFEAPVFEASAAPAPSATAGPAAPEARVAAPVAPPAPRATAPPELPRPITVTPGTPPPRHASELWYPGPRRTFADEQVWPPVARAAEEPPGSSTQPFPAVPAAPPSPRTAPEQPEDPREAREASGTGARASRAEPSTATGVASETAAGAVPEPRVSGEDAPVWEEPAPARRRTALRIGVVSLVAALVVVLAAVVAVTLTPGVPTRNDHRPHQAGVPAPRVHVVPPGDTGVLMNVAWKVDVDQADALPDARPAGPGLRWLKITVTRTSLNAEGVARRAAPGIEVRHPDGRSWQTEIVRDGLPVAVGDHLVGAEYAYEAISLVPREVAGQVEVRITPSAARMPLEDRMPLEEESAEMFARPDSAEPEPGDQVLLFRR